MQITITHGWTRKKNCCASRPLWKINSIKRFTRIYKCRNDATGRSRVLQAMSFVINRCPSVIIEPDKIENSWGEATTRCWERESKHTEMTPTFSPIGVKWNIQPYTIQAMKYTSVSFHKKISRLQRGACKLVEQVNMSKNEDNVW